MKALVFPGQGSQTVGMLNSVLQERTVKDLVEKANNVLNFDLADLIANDAEKLNQTAYTQPAILLTSIAFYQLALESGMPLPEVLAGHSLGEYSALVAAGSLSFEDAIKTVHLRGKLMQNSLSDETEGAMAAILGADLELIEATCLEVSNDLQQVVPANMNCPGQIVISGHKIAVLAAIELFKAKGIKRCIVLPVSIPSHCPLMLPASEKLSEALNAIKVEAPKIPVLHNVDVQSYSKSQEIIEILTAQLYRPVQWIQTVEKMEKMGVDTLIEIGPGKVLTGLNKKISKTLNLVSLNTLEQIKAYNEEVNHG